MKFRLVLAAALSAILLGQQPSLPKGVQKLTTVEGITEYRLENGLKVLLFPDASKPTVTVNVTYMVGSKHENYGETGMAHLLEHLVFKGTEKRKNVIVELQEHGANFNGTTSDDRTNYFETMTANDENLKWALEMEADRMVNSRIAKSDLDTEMTVVRNEFEMGENSPQRITMQRTIAAAYEWHNYGKSTIGARSDIENVPIDRLKGFYQRYYQPDNAMLVVAGKFDEPKTLNWIAEYFAPIPKPAREIQRTYTKEPVQDGERSVTVRRVGDVQLLASVYHLPAGTHDDFAPLQVLVDILGDTPSGRLHKAMVDNKKAAMVFGFGNQLHEAGYALFGAQLNKQQNMNEARELLLKGVEGVAAEPPTKEEVDRARTKILKNIELSLANSGRVGVELSEWESMADWRMMFVNRDRLKKVTPEDVQRVAKIYFKESNRTLGQFIPTEKPDRAEIPDAPNVNAIVKDYKGTEQIAQGEAFDASYANVESRTQRSALPNGMKLLMLPKKNRGEVVSAQVLLRQGTEKSLFGKVAVSGITATMLNRGTSKHTRQQIEDEFNRLKAQVSFGGSPASTTATIQTVRGNLAETLKLVAEILQDPSFPEQELEPVRSRALSGIEQSRREPMAVASLELNKVLRNYPKGDIRAVRTPDEQTEDLKAVTLEQVKQFHKDFYGASYGTISVVGDFDATEISALAKTLFGNWKSPQPYVRVKEEYSKEKTASRTLDTPDKANAMFVAGMNLNMNDDHPDYPALTIANYIIGGSANSHLFNRLRQKEGFSYGAGSQLAIQAQANGSAFVSFAILAPDNITKLENAFRDEIGKILKDGLTAEEIAQAKKAWKQELAIQRSQDGALRGMLIADDFYGRTMKWREGVEAKVDALTPDQVNAALRKHISLDALTVVRAGDLKKAGLTAN